MFGHLITHALGRTSGGRFINMLSLVGFVLLLPIGAVAGISYFVWNELSTESRYQHSFGADWKAQYEMDYGPVSAARVKVAVAIGGALFLAAVGVWLYRQLIPALMGTGSTGNPTRSPRRRRRRT